MFAHLLCAGAEFLAMCDGGIRTFPWVGRRLPVKPYVFVISLTTLIA